jgi:hypothetical protein
MEGQTKRAWQKKKHGLKEKPAYSSCQTGESIVLERRPFDSANTDNSRSCPENNDGLPTISSRSRPYRYLIASNRRNDCGDNEVRPAGDADSFVSLRFRVTAIEASVRKKQ